MEKEKVDNTRRGRLPPTGTKATPFTDSGLAARVEELRKVSEEIRGSGGDVWVGYTKPAIQSYRVVRGLDPMPSRTMSRRTSKLHPVKTKDKKWFYFDAPVPPDVRKKIGQVRVREPTDDDTLIVTRDRHGRSSAWLFHPSPVSKIQ